jgi:hypothetical protein
MTFRVVGRLALLLGLLLPVGACAGSEPKRLAFTEEQLAATDVSLVLDRLGGDERVAVLIDGGQGSTGTVLVGASAGTCESVDAVQLKGRTLTVVFQRQTLGQGEACILSRRVIGLRVEVASPVDAVTSVAH